MICPDCDGYGRIRYVYEGIFVVVRETKVCVRCLGKGRVEG